MTYSEDETGFELPGEMPKGLEARVRRTLKNREAAEQLLGTDKFNEREADEGLPFDELIGQAVELHSLRKAHATLQLEAAVWKRKYFELLVGESEQATMNSRQRKKAVKQLEVAQQEEEEALAVPDVELPDIDLYDDPSTIRH